MSLFLGPIHHWLYKKIGNQEDLTARLAREGEKRAWIEDGSSYVKTLAPLEEVVDTGNIHAWLQEQIIDGEKRYGSLVKAILKEKPERLATLKNLTFAFGRENSPGEISSLEEIYQYFEDFFVNGMPCDRINQVTDQDEKRLAWTMKEDLHSKYWPQEEGQAYYLLRKAIMDGILDDSGYHVTMKDPSHYILEKED